MNNTHFYSSVHSLIRAKERAGLNTKRAQKMIGLAIERGIRSNECRWSVDRRYLESKSNDKIVAVAFNGFCYLFQQENGCCITLFPLPKNFGKKKTFYHKEEENYVSHQQCWQW